MAIVKNLQVLNFMLVINMVSSSFVAKNFKACTCVSFTFFVGTVTIIENLYVANFLLLLVGFPLSKPLHWVGSNKGGRGCLFKGSWQQKKQGEHAWTSDHRTRGCHCQKPNSHVFQNIGWGWWTKAWKLLTIFVMCFLCHQMLQVTKYLFSI